MKKFTIFTIVICSFCLITTNESKANKNNKLQKFETSIKLGASKHNVGFDTPYTHSVLSWDTDTIDLGLDIKYNISDKMFTLLEYNYGTIKGGKSADDDVQNGSGEYSTHGVEGRTNDYKLNFGYKVFERNNISLSPTAGIFHKDIKVMSTNGYGIGGVYGNGESFEGEEYGNQTHSKYTGLMAGIRIGKKQQIQKVFYKWTL